MVWYKANVDILNCVGVTRECDRQTDGRRTEIHVANAMLHYVVQPKVLLEGLVILILFLHCVQGEVKLPHPRFNVDFPVIMYEMNEQ